MYDVLQCSAVPAKVVAKCCVEGHGTLVLRLETDSLSLNILSPLGSRTYDPDTG